VRLKSIKKRWASRAFAAGVDRDHVAAATEDFSRVCFGGGLELWEHVQNVLEAMQAAAEELELDGRLAG
jgi:predicted hydrolase (HD superfamily)